MMRIDIVADHGGFGLKIKLTAALKSASYEVADFSTHELVTGDDYPNCVVPPPWPVAKGELTRGLANCGSVVGAALITDPFCAYQRVEDDDMNVMYLGQPGQPKTNDIQPGWLVVVRWHLRTCDVPLVRLNVIMGRNCPATQALLDPATKIRRSAPCLRSWRGLVKLRLRQRLCGKRNR